MQPTIAICDIQHMQIAEFLPLLTLTAVEPDNGNEPKSILNTFAHIIHIFIDATEFCVG